MRFLEKATRSSWDIYLPSNEPQHLYYSGHRKHHCIHTQIVIASDLRICHVESGFMGHSNDAESFRMMTPIGVGRVLAFLRDCYFLGNSIYLNRYPIVTTFSSAQFRRQPENIKWHWQKIDKGIRRYRVLVEQAIFQHLNISTLYRHSRAEIRDMFCLCTCLFSSQKNKIFLVRYVVHISISVSTVCIHSNLKRNLQFVWIPWGSRLE
jgi:hypothetical protein